ncbi:MAG: hypothetical protein R3F02_18725 [Thiolinea sp.]
MTIFVRDADGKLVLDTITGGCNGCGDNAAPPSKPAAEAEPEPTPPTPETTDDEVNDDGTPHD